MSSDDRLDERIRAAASDYREPPETPREAMWERIQAARAGRELREAAARRRRGRWMRRGIGIAAVLVAGIAIGRLSSPAGSRAPQVATTASGSGAGGAAAGRAPASAAGTTGSRALVAYRVAAAEHLGRVEAFLTLFRREAATGRVDGDFRAPARSLLSDTRLLQASPAADDPALRAVLGDVELVLAQIAQYTEEPSRRQDLRFIDQGMEQRGVLLELRTMVTTARPSGLAQGAL
ncbi:MAG: hypothetical protein Q8W51_08665 [Candidatus Palauibacterales bacterium]|nr:hypothetical protein [Candidatus Palauibacterales bacterium]MDP2529797.1 hypothetical protein [Candidatus Palauibacterales bacterium]MDP2582689.1 hypothetical protein [Candidatus Palauibacterales bacterium]